MTKEEARAKAGIVYDSSATEGGWDNLSPEEIAERLNEKVAEGMINISCQHRAVSLRTVLRRETVMIVNESINNYPQKVQIVRNDTGEQILREQAQSPLAAKSNALSSTWSFLPVHTNVPHISTTLTRTAGEIIGTAGAIINITIKN